MTLILQISVKCMEGLYSVVNRKTISSDTSKKKSLNVIIGILFYCIGICFNMSKNSLFLRVKENVIPPSMYLNNAFNNYHIYFSFMHELNKKRILKEQVKN